MYNQYQRVIVFQPSVWSPQSDEPDVVTERSMFILICFWHARLILRNSGVEARLNAGSFNYRNYSIARGGVATDAIAAAINRHPNRAYYLISASIVFTVMIRSIGCFHT